MTSGELIRAARLRAGLSQDELAERLGVPHSSIARWEVDRVEPGLSTLRRILQACGYDLSLTLVPFERDPERDARVREEQQLTPQERLRDLLGGSRTNEPGPVRPVRDPARARAGALDYMIIGGLARVLQGSDELTHGVDFTPRQ